MSMSPRTRCESVIKYIVNELDKKNMKPLNVYKMADVNNKGSVHAKVIEQSLKKFLPHVQLEVFNEAMHAFRLTNTESISRDDFILVFNIEDEKKSESNVFKKSN